MGDFKPIETFYNGYHFRSRLEARWAVFFDKEGIRYVYEPEGFEITLSDGEVIRYLPDFYLPDYKLYAEVKGVDSINEIPASDVEKMSWMIDFDGPCSNGIILLGNIPSPEFAQGLNYLIWKWSGEGLDLWYAMDYRLHDESLWDSIPEYCDGAPATRFSFDKDVANRHLGTHAYYDPNVPCYPKGYKRYHPALLAARQARFEHGETPQIKRPRSSGN